MIFFFNVKPGHQGYNHAINGLNQLLVRWSIVSCLGTNVHQIVDQYVMDSSVIIKNIVEDILKISGFVAIFIGKTIFFDNNFILFYFIAGINLCK